MRKPQWWALGALLGTLGLVFGLASPAQSQRIIQGQGQGIGQRPQGDDSSLRGRLVKQTKVAGNDVDKLLAALGPAVTDMLRSGQQVSIPGLGTFRVVNIPPHRDLAGGRAALVPGSNYVEFLPVAEMVNAANASGAVPAESVPPFFYNPLPNQTPSPRVGTIRSTGTRTR
jgi:nucleoid DNA-binding protein